MEYKKKNSTGCNDCCILDKLSSKQAEKKEDLNSKRLKVEKVIPLVVAGNKEITSLIDKANSLEK